MHTLWRKILFKILEKGISKVHLKYLCINPKVHLRGHTLYERIFQEDKGEKAHAGKIKDNPDITDKVFKINS